MVKGLVLEIKITREMRDNSDCFVYLIQHGDSAEDIIKSLDQFLTQENVIAEIINKLVLEKLHSIKIITKPLLHRIRSNPFNKKLKHYE